MICDAILAVDSQLGVEIANEEEGGIREAIITAFSAAELFPLVHQIVAQLSDIPGWRIVVLKPPRGFEFTLTVDGREVEASKLEFAPIRGIDRGIQLIAGPQLLSCLPTGQEREEFGWLIVETGVGEELAGRLRHIEFAEAGKVAGQLPITTQGTLLGEPKGDIAKSRGDLRKMSNIAASHVLFGSRLAEGSLLRHPPRGGSL